MTHRKYTRSFENPVLEQHTRGKGPKLGYKTLHCGQGIPISQPTPAGCYPQINESGWATIRRFTVKRCFTGNRRRLRMYLWQLRNRDPLHLTQTVWTPSDCGRGDAAPPSPGLVSVRAGVVPSNFGTLAFLSQGGVKDRNSWWISWLFVARTSGPPSLCSEHPLLT